MLLPRYAQKLQDGERQNQRTVEFQWLPTCLRITREKLWATVFFSEQLLYLAVTSRKCTELQLGRESHNLYLNAEQIKNSD